MVVNSYAVIISLSQSYAIVCVFRDKLLSNNLSSDNYYYNRRLALQMVIASMTGVDKQSEKLFLSSYEIIC